MTFKALDLYCKAGGSARGLARAGARVWGIDKESQPNYPYDMDKRDVLTLSPDYLRLFDFIWASPPCQANSALKHAPNAKKHEDLIPQTRELLQAAGVPYVIENVVGAETLRPNLTLCGSHFDLGVSINGKRYHTRRHRVFETNFPVPQPKCHHPREAVIGIYGGHIRCRAKRYGGRGTREAWFSDDSGELAAEALDLSGVKMTMDEYSNAIPPAYSCYIATHWLAQR